MRLNARVTGAAPRTDVAALYVDARGPYPKLVQWPVVAHPPCGPYSKQRHLYRGNEHGLAPVAVEQVRRWGGVLEHPADSQLWKLCRLPLPGELPDAFGGWTIEVSQVDWGHVARKRTWLYFVGVPRSALTFPPKREPTHWVSGGRKSHDGKRRGLVPPGIKVCSSQQRHRTPVAFAEWLLDLASRASRKEAA